MLQVNVRTNFDREKFTKIIQPLDMNLPEFFYNLKYYIFYAGVSIFKNSKYVKKPDAIGLQA